MDLSGTRARHQNNLGDARCTRLYPVTSQIILILPKKVYPPFVACYFWFLDDDRKGSRAVQIGIPCCVNRILSATFIPLTKKSIRDKTQFIFSKKILNTFVMQLLTLVVLAFVGAIPASAAPVAPNPSTFNTGNGHGSCVGFGVCGGSTNGAGVGNCDGVANCNGAGNSNGFLNSNGASNSNGYDNSNGFGNSNGIDNSNGFGNSNGVGNSNGI
jgi:hypothetical protein